MIRKLNHSSITINAIPFAVFHVDLSGVILSCNDSAEKFTGYSSHELEGQLVEILIPAASAPAEVGRAHTRRAAPREMGAGQGFRRTSPATLVSDDALERASLSFFCKCRA